MTRARGTGYGLFVPRASSFVRWIVLALIVGLAALHLPLDAVRLHGPAPARVAAKVKACAKASCCAPKAPVAAPGDGSAPALDEDPPAPQDGCDPGCHCGCCGGLPLVAEVRPTVTLETASETSVAPARSTARGARRLEIFHPPRA